MYTFFLGVTSSNLRFGPHRIVKTDEITYTRECWIRLTIRFYLRSYNQHRSPQPTVKNQEKNQKNQEHFRKKSGKSKNGVEAYIFTHNWTLKHTRCFNIEN